jgi:hypothetical protein
MPFLRGGAHPAAPSHRIRVVDRWRRRSLAAASKRLSERRCSVRRNRRGQARPFRRAGSLRSGRPARVRRYCVIRGDARSAQVGLSRVESAVEGCRREADVLAPGLRRRRPPRQAGDTSSLSPCSLAGLRHQSHRVRPGNRVVRDRRRRLLDVMRVIRRAGRTAKCRSRSAGRRSA